LPCAAARLDEVWSTLAEWLAGRLVALPATPLDSAGADALLEAGSVTGVVSAGVVSTGVVSTGVVSTGVVSTGVLAGSVTGALELGGGVLVLGAGPGIAHPLVWIVMPCVDQFSE